MNEKHEAIQLRLGQRIGAFLLDGVLRRQNKERRGQREEPPGDGDAVFLHRFQQGGLRFGRRAVDFVGQDDVGEERPLDEDEGAAARLVGFLENIRSGDVRGHQVGRELDAVELQGHRPAPGQLTIGGFGQARHAHEQAVSARQNADEQLFEHVVLADDDLGQFAAHLAVRFAQFGDGANVILRQSRGCRRRRIRPLCFDHKCLLLIAGEL